MLQTRYLHIEFLNLNEIHLDSVDKDPQETPLTVRGRQAEEDRMVVEAEIEVDKKEVYLQCRFYISTILHI